MSTVLPLAVAGYPAESGLRTPVASMEKRSSRLDVAVVALLSMFAFVLATDLRMAGGTSIAMRLGYASLLLGSIGVIKRKSAVVPTPGLWCLLGFVVWSSCTLAWAEFPVPAQHKVLTYWVLLALAAIVPQYAWDSRTRTKLIDWYVAGCWLGVIGTAANFAAGVVYCAEGAQEMEGRYSFGTDPNYLALALVLGIPLALFRSATAKAS